MKKRVLMFVFSVFLMAGILPVRAAGASEVTVSFRLINGTWPEGGSSRRVPFAMGYVLSDADIPKDMSPNDGYGGGGWQVEPVGTVLDSDVTFKFSYQLLLDVHFDPNGGQWADGAAGFTAKAAAGGICTAWPGEPQRAGFAFAGWRTESGEAFSVDTVISNSVTVYAHWRENRTLTLDANGGNWPQPLTAELPGGLIDCFPAPPEREGYEFGHWNTQADGGGQILTPGTLLNENTTAYAQWRRIFILYLDGNDGNSVEELRFTAEEAGISSHAFVVPNTGRPGHRLLGWNTAADGSGTAVAVGSGYAVDEAHNPATLYAQWERCCYQVAFDGTEVVRDCLWGDALGGSFPTPTPPEPGKFRFDGWYTEKGSLFSGDTPVTGNLTVYPHWVPQAEVTFQILNGTWKESKNDTYTITLDLGAPLADRLPTAVPDPAYKETGAWNITPVKAADGAVFSFACDARKRFQVTFDTEDAPIEVLEGQCTALPTPTQAGARFDGWYTAKTGGEKFGETTPVLKNTSLFARWTPIFTLTYDANGGENAPEADRIEVSADTNTFTISAVIPTRAGYSFEGWAHTADAQLGLLHGGDPCSADGDVTLYAVWKKDTNHVSVTFFDRDAETEKLTLPSGQSLGADLPEPPEWKGHRFLGWNFEADGTGEVLTKYTVISANTTVYACWEALPRFTVTFIDRGREVDWFTLDAGDCVGGNMPMEPSRKGFTFSGWSTENGTGLDASTSVAQNLTVYASWEKITRGTITFLDGDTELYQIALDLGAKIGDNLPADPALPGFHFLGWNTREDGTGSKLYRSTVLREDLTVWAQWEEIQYVSLTFYNLFGDTESLTVEQNTKAGDQFPANPSRPGYTFKGWYTEPSGDGRKVTKTTKIQDDTEVYAYWRQKNSTNAKTGDSTDIYLWMALLFTSSVALFSLKKRKG